MYTGKPKTSSNIAWHRPQSSTARIDEELMHNSSRALCHTTDPLEKLRLLCLSRGSSGIMILGRIFRRMDEEEGGSRRLTKDAFLHVIRETGLELSMEEAEELFDQFDDEKCGSINLDEFLLKIRPPMAESRQHIVEEAYRKLDTTGKGAISVDQIKAVYSVNSQPRYMSGEESAEKVMNMFLSNFEAEGVLDGKVTLEEFLNYYSAISVSIDNDCYFDLMMRQMFKL